MWDISVYPSQRPALCPGRYTLNETHQNQENLQHFDTHGANFQQLYYTVDGMHTYNYSEQTYHIIISKSNFINV